MVASLDTLEISKRLRQAGFTEPQAEVVTAVLRETREFDLAELATKGDLALVRADLDHLRSDMENGFAAVRSDMEREFAAVRLESGVMRRELDSRIDALRSELVARIEAAKSDTIKWVIGIAFAQAATILAVLRFFPGPHG
jgi:hypothetical protein